MIREFARTPDGLQGELSLDSDRFSFELAEFAVNPRRAFENDDPPQRIQLSLANGKSAVLYDSIRGSLASTWRSDGAYLRRAIVPSRVYIGATALDAEECDRITFETSSPELAIYWRGHQSASIAIDPSTIEIRYDLGQTNAATIELSGREISLDIQITQTGSGQGSSISEHRYCVIHYHNRTPVNAALDDVDAVCQFFSFVIGAPVTPSKIQITQGQHPNRSEFDLFLRSKSVPEIDRLKVDRLLAAPQFDREDYQNALAGWVNRTTEWGDAHALMREVFAKSTQLSRDRYMDACGLFESIPVFYLTPTLGPTRDAILAAAKSAAASFGKNGHVVPVDRLRGLLGNLGNESFNGRLRAAATWLNGQFGEGTVPQPLISRINIIGNLRGPVAHGAVSGWGGNLQNLVIAQYLIEYMSGLLLMHGLGWRMDRIDRANNHPLAQYRHLLMTNSWTS